MRYTQEELKNMAIEVLNAIVLKDPRGGQVVDVLVRRTGIPPPLIIQQLETFAKEVR